MDPLTELVVALEREGRPPLAWVVRHARGGTGDEALERVWLATRSPESQVRLLELAHDPHAAAARRVLGATFISPQTDRDRARADAIRRLVPTPPSLTALLAAQAFKRLVTLTWTTERVKNSGAGPDTNV